MSKHKKGDNRRVIRKNRRSIETDSCSLCMHYKDELHGCKFDACVYDETALEAEVRNRYKRKRGSYQWET